jgi:hypothetical protein
VNAPVRPNGVNGFVVAGVDVEHPDHHDQQHDRDLEHHQVGLEPGGPLHAPVQDERDEQAEQHREQVHHVGAGATTSSDSVPGAPSIHGGSWTPMKPSSSLKYPEMPLATTATIACTPAAGPSR